MEELRLPRLFRGREPACSAGDAGEGGVIPGWGRSPGGGNGNPLQYSCLENPRDRRAWPATVQEVSESQTGQRNRGCMQCKTTRGIPGRNMFEEEGFLSKAPKTILLG